LVAPRHSAAGARALRGRGGQRSVAVALAANVVVTVAKVGSRPADGSAALLAEAVHSAADSSNEIPLGFGGPPTSRFVSVRDRRVLSIAGPYRAQRGAPARLCDEFRAAARSYSHD
jgi:hypothetical protein